jgi:hypothetical protein
LGSPREEIGGVPRARAGGGGKKLVAVLLYSLDFPPETERKIVEDSRRFGDPLPDKIKNKPHLFLGLSLYLNAWFELDPERSHHHGLERIKRSTIFEYANDYGLSEEQTEDMIFYLREMDTAHLDRLKARQPKPETKGKRGRK